MAGEKFYLIFSDTPKKRIRINEPIGYSEVDFNLDRKENGMGLDVSLSGGSIKFRFTLYRHGNTFKKLLYYAHYYGFESDVKIIIALSSGEEYKGELDFVLAETNDYNYFECPVIVESETQIFKRRSETKVDLFSSVDINGEAIEPLKPVNMLLQAKPSMQTSTWEQVADYLASVFIFNDNKRVYYYPLDSLITSDAKDSYSFFELESKELSTFKIFTSRNNSNSVNLKIHVGEIRLFDTNPFTTLTFKVLWGKDIATANQKILTGGFTGAVTILNRDFIVPAFSLTREDSIWVAIEMSTTLAGQVYGGQLSVKGLKQTLSVDSSAYNTITPVFRLIDVMKQVTKSISGLDIYAPRFDLGGEFYDNVITSGKLLGGNITDPFYVSWDDLFNKSVSPELHADSDIQLDNRVFAGLEQDFFTSEECGLFLNTQFSTMSRKPNPMYCINEFNYKYENYQSLKENTEPNSDSTIHGQSIFTPYNQKVENSKELSIKWIRDSILLDVQQRLSTIVSKDTATQDDDKIFVIDTISTEGDKYFTETTTLQHTFSGSYLSIRSSGDINFSVLGIQPDTVFAILYPDPNNGNYSVYQVTATELQLIRTSPGSISASNNGVRLTKYTYQIKQEFIPLTNRTNQGFTVVNNLISPEKYSNMRYSVERNIRNQYNRFLATVNIYHKDKPLRNTYYKNNGKCETEYNGLRVIEKEDWIPTDPIFTPYMYENVIFANVEFSRFLKLQTELRSKRGFIRTIDNNKRVLKLYPLKMSYENKTRQLTISGQEKFQKAYLTIVTEPNNILINDETRIKRLNYDKAILDRDKLVVLFDMERQRLYNGIFWDKVSVNGVSPETLEELKDMLDLL